MVDLGVVAATPLVDVLADDGSDPIVVVLGSRRDGFTAAELEPASAA